MNRSVRLFEFETHNDDFTDSVITTRNSGSSFDSVPRTESIAANVSTIVPTTSEQLFHTAREAPALKELATKAMPSPPTITITSTNDEKSIDGMLDRISHDLDYLLNRTTDMPTQI